MMSGQRKTAQYILFGTVIAAVIQIMYYYPYLPERMAIHFNVSGQADNFSSKFSASIFQIGLTLFIVVLFKIIGILLTKASDGLINLPNKEYWLAPERRAATIDYMENMVYRMGGITNIFLLLVFQLVINTNLEGDYSLGVTFWIVLAVYMFGIIVSVVKIITRFSKT